MKAFSIITIALALAGCGPEANMPMFEPSTSVSEANISTNIRFKVVRVGIFSDNLAYGGKRGIYVITDTDTGREFVGVSGVGISELGSHQSGKTISRDER